MPEFERAGIEYLVRVPAGALLVYRFVRNAEAPAEEFASNAALGKRRRRRVEDAADFFGVSAFESLEQASAFAADLNQRLRLARSRILPFTHIAEFAVRGTAGHALARTGEVEGHYTVWGEPDELAEGVVRVIAIAAEGT